jgi:hypothetical protein
MHRAGRDLCEVCSTTRLRILARPFTWVFGIEIKSAGTFASEFQRRTLHYRGELCAATRCSTASDLGRQTAMDALPRVLRLGFLSLQRH